MPPHPRLIYLPDDAPTFTEIADLLREQFAGAKQRRSKTGTTLAFDGDTVKLVENAGTEALAFAKQLAAVTTREARPAMDAATHRIEISGKRDAYRVWEALIEIPGAVGYDPSDGAIRICEATYKRRAKKKSARTK